MVMMVSRWGGGSLKGRLVNDVRVTECKQSHDFHGHQLMNRLSWGCFLISYVIVCTVDFEPWIESLNKKVTL